MPNNIIITGANGNLGTAVVKKFLDSGFKVIAVDHSGNHLGFAEGHDNFELHAVNLGNESETDSFMKEAISLNGQIHAAALLVGGFAMGAVKDTNMDSLKKMYSLNFETVYNAARPLFLHMLDNNYGRIIFVGARPALKPEQGKNMIAYALSKSLLFKLAEFMNAEAKGKNVFVSVIVPSTIDTPINRQSMPDANPDNWVKAEEVAEILDFICSEKAAVIREPVYKLYNNS
jgi:NAD(P)-dependent dehydrogenase (short-subunit alcohol dehydrogenase family)